MFIHAYIPKSKPKIRYLLLMVLAVVLIFSVTKPLETKATETNVEGEDFSKAVGGGNGAYDPSKLGYDVAGSAKTGWLVYLVDTSGSVSSDVVYVNCYGKPSGYNTSNLYTRIGYKIPTKFFTGAKWGPPFDTNQASRAAEIKKYLEDEVVVKGQTMAQAAKVVGYYLGEDALKKFTQEYDKYYLVMDACAYCGIIIGTSNGYAQSLGVAASGQKVLASAYGWGKLEQTMLSFPGAKMNEYGNIGDGSKGDVSWCTNRALQITCHLYQKWPGLPAVPTVFSEEDYGRLSCYTISSYTGYGELAVRGKRGEMIHTYWQDNGSPGDPEPPGETKKGDCNIVKSYYTKRIKDGETTYEDDTNKYNTEKCTNVVSIDNEPDEYKLKKWRVSNTYKANVKAVTGGEVTWSSNAPAKASGSGNSGTSEKVVTIDENQTVYVLLERVIEEDTTEEVEANYNILESQITSHVYLSEPDEGCQEIETKIQDVEFQWHLPAHVTECGGHTVPTDVDCDGSCKPKVDHKHTDKCAKDCKIIYDYGAACGKKHKGTKKVKCSNYKLTDNELSFSLKETNHTGSSTVLANKWQKVISPDDADESYIDVKREGTAESTVKSSGWDYECVIYRGKDKLTLAEWKNAAKGIDMSPITDLGFSADNVPKGTRKNPDTGYYMDKFSLKFEDNSSDKDTTATAKTVPSEVSSGCTDKKTATFLNPLAINNITVRVDCYAGSPIVDDDTTETGSNLVESGETISFYPYIQMRYDTRTEEDKKMYVLGEYKRSFNPTDYFYVSLGSDPSNVTITSNQWSTHSQAVTDHGMESVLPGGAMLSISTDDIKKVTVTTQQVILKDDGLTQVEKTNGSGTGLTQEEAVANHQSLVADIWNSLDNTHIGQYVKNGRKTILATPGKDLSVISGDGGPKGKASTDEKYYFRFANSSLPICEGDLDVQDKDTVTGYKTYYTIPTSSEIKTKSEGAYFTDKTKTKSKLQAALELGGYGNGDSEAEWADGDAWYNEAFDGVTVMYQKTTLEVGLFEPKERTSILDPKLIPQSNNKGDLFTKYLESWYRSYGNVKGSFKGGKVNKSASTLYKSKTFYIPNVTTQDLN